MDTIIELEERFNNHYGEGLSKLAKGMFEEAKKHLSIAFTNCLALAKECTGTLQTSRLKKAEDILVLINKINIKEKQTGFNYIPNSFNQTGSTNSNNSNTNNITNGDSKFKETTQTNSKIKLTDVCGLEEVKDEIYKKFINPIKYPDIFKKFKKKAGGGILLYGVPGTGKTMIAEAIANEINAKFFPIRCSDLISRWFGESEQNIKRLFDEARKAERAIIFFDEFDAIAASRESFNDNQPMKRIVPELLSQIQGFNASTSNVLIIAATNRPWDIDSAFLRPGRFNVLIPVDLPNEEARLNIVSKQLRGIPKDKDFDKEEVAKVTLGFTGADVVEFCDRLKDLAIDRTIKLEVESGICNEDIKLVKAKMNSSVRLKDLEKIKKYQALNRVA